MRYDATRRNSEYLFIGQNDPAWIDIEIIILASTPSPPVQRGLWTVNKTGTRLAACLSLGEAPRSLIRKSIFFIIMNDNESTANKVGKGSAEMLIENID